LEDRASGRAPTLQRVIDPTDQVRDRRPFEGRQAVDMGCPHPIADERKDILLTCHWSDPFDRTIMPANR
jgi:hypothetical protein